MIAVRQRSQKIFKPGKIPNGFAVVTGFFPNTDVAINCFQVK